MTRALDHEEGKSRHFPSLSLPFHLHYLHYSDSPSGRLPAWPSTSRYQTEITCWQSNQQEGAGAADVISVSVLWFLIAPLFWRSRSSTPIQKCPIITDLSVLIFINNCACDDPAGMLMSTQLELISCRPPQHSPRILCAPAQRWGLRTVRQTLHHSLLLGSIKQKCLFCRIFYFLVKVYVHSLRRSPLGARFLHLIRRAISPADRPPTGSPIQRSSSANGSRWALCSP